MKNYYRNALLRKIAKEKKRSTYDEVRDRYTPIVEETPDLVYKTIATGGTFPLMQALGVDPTIGGTAAHLFADAPDKKDLDDLKNVSSTAIFPVASSYRAALRDMYVDNKLSKGKSVRKHRLAELWGPGVQMGLSGLAGGLLGFGIPHLLGVRNETRHVAALAGLLLGVGASGVSSLVGRVSGLIGGPKDDKEHAEYLSKSVAPHYLLPGYGAYHSGRRARTIGNIFA